MRVSSQGDEADEKQRSSEEEEPEEMQGTGDKDKTVHKQPGADEDMECQGLDHPDKTRRSGHSNHPQGTVPFRVFPTRRCTNFELSNAIERFVLGIAGIPSLVAKRTLYTHRSHGLKLCSLAVLQPTSVLDSLHHNPQLSSLRTHTKWPMSPYSMYTRALELLGPPTDVYHAPSTCHLEGPAPPEERC